MVKNVDSQVKVKPKNSLVFRIGVGLLLAACVLWAGVLAVPFLAVSIGIKTSIIAGMLIVGEAVFWVGAVLTGKEFVDRYKDKLRLKVTKDEG